MENILRFFRTWTASGITNETVVLVFFLLFGQKAMESSAGVGINLINIVMRINVIGDLKVGFENSNVVIYGCGRNY